MTGSTKCYHHGGASPGGPIKHGRYSAVAGKYREAIESSRTDATLLDLREPIAILDALVKGALERASSGDSPELRKRALKLAQEAITASRVENIGVVDERLASLEGLLREGIAEDRNTRVLVDRTVKLRRAIEGAWSVKLARKQVLNVREMTAIIARMLGVVRDRVDAVTYTGIVHEVDAVVMGNVSGKALGEKKENTEQSP